MLAKIAGILLSATERIQRALMKIRVGPGLTAEMDRWEKATENLIKLREHGLTPAEIEAHRERMTGLVTREEFSPEVTELLVTLLNSMAYHAGSSALLNALHWNNLYQRVSAGSRSALKDLSEMYHGEAVRKAVEDMEFALSILDAIDGFDDRLGAILQERRQDPAFPTLETAEHIAKTTKMLTGRD